MVTIESAGPGHVAAIGRIHAQQARDGYATFDGTGLPDRVWEQRRRSDAPGDALLVGLDVAGRVLGFAWSHAYRPKPAYATTRETTVYVDPAETGAGVARALYAELLGQVAAAGTHLVVAGVAEPNPASTRLHERMGFTRVGTMTEVGHKHGHFRDVTWWQRLLDGTGPDGTGRVERWPS